MRKFLAVLLLVAGCGGPAFAAGGMGDSSRHTREMNAICELQRRGEYAPTPNMCLPEYPLAPVPRQAGPGEH